MDANKKQVGGEHYRNKAVQPWDAMEAWLTPAEFLGFLRGNAVKYLARCNDKGGVEDVRKAKHYLEKWLEVAEAEDAKPLWPYIDPLGVRRG